MAISRSVADNEQRKFVETSTGQPGVVIANPDGTTIGSEVTQVYSLRYDEGATYTYIGEAAPGTAESAAGWRIKRMTNADTSIVWIDGNANFDNVWNDRAAGVYT